MALTDATLLRFDGPVVWGENDCIQFLFACAGLAVPEDLVWYRECTTERRASVRARMYHDTFEGALLWELHRHGYFGTLPKTLLLPGDICIIDDPVYGIVPAGVTPGLDIVMRTPFGIGPASGGIRHHMSRTHG